MTVLSIVPYEPSRARVITSRGAQDSRTKRSVVGIAVGAASWVASASAGACPSCPVGQTARQQVLEQDFGTNLLIAVIPFLLVALFARWAERIGAESVHGKRKVE